MRSAVRSLHRYYACLVAQAALEPVTDDFAQRWENAIERGEDPPGLMDLAQAVVAAGVPILSPRPVASYLRQCAASQRVPDPGRIVQAIVHALAETDLLNKDKTCRCPARRPLIPSPTPDAAL